MKALTGHFFRSAAAIGLLGACAYEPSAELSRARATYAQAEREASSTAPQAVAVARQAVARANQMDEDYPGSDEAKDQAYIAMRLSEAAQARGKAARTKTLAMQTSERRAKERAQKESLAAQQKKEVDLDQLPGTVITDERGTVIRSDDLSFESDEAMLSEEGKDFLKKVADATKKSEAPIVVEGHTDDTGSDDHNMDLSNRRATAAHEYLRSLGVETDTKGVGEKAPVADNTTQQGRAANRRVEIVIERGAETPR